MADIMTREEFENYKNAFKSRKKLPKTAVDITGTVLSPGRPDICKGNGKSYDEKGRRIECCCDECDYLMACMEDGFDDLTYEDYLYGKNTEHI